MSVVYVGAYAWSYNNEGSSSSSSVCGSTTAIGVSVSVSNAPSSRCSSATTIIGGWSLGANAYGGSMSVVYVGAYAWSYNDAGSSSSVCGTTTASGVSVSVSNAPSSSCSAVTNANISGPGLQEKSFGMNSYGGSMSVVYVGAYAWSLSGAISSSVCGSTTAIGMSVSVSNAPSFSCSAVTTTIGGGSFGANAYGGSMSVVYVGAYAWSISFRASSSSTCGSTSASGVSVSVSNSPSSSCSAVTSSNAFGSYGANTYGGSMSVVYIGAYAWSVSAGSSLVTSHSHCDSTLTVGLSLLIKNSTFCDSSAISLRTFATQFYLYAVQIRLFTILQKHAVDLAAPTLVCFCSAFSTMFRFCVLCVL